jgi:hypothetical protein
VVLVEHNHQRENVVLVEFANDRPKSCMDGFMATRDERSVLSDAKLHIVYDTH